MKKEEIEKIYNSLNKWEQKVYDLRMQGVKVEDIAKKNYVPYSASYIYNKIDPKLFDAFGVNNWKELEEKVKKDVESDIPTGKEDKYEPKVELDDKVSENSEIDDTTTIKGEVTKPKEEFVDTVSEAKEPEKPVVKEEETKKNVEAPKKKYPWYIVTIPIFIVLIFLFWFFSKSIFPRTIDQSNASTPTSTGASIVYIETQKTTVAPSNTTNTQIPQETATPPIFSDNFDSGIKSEWTVINGIPGIVNGEFTSQSDTVWLSLALPPDTKNYVVEADLLSAGGCGSPGTIIAPVFVDPNNYIGLFVTGCQQNWKIVTDGKDQTPGLEHENKRGSHFKFVAQNNNITLFIDGVEAGSIYNNLLAQGLIGLYMFKEVRINNFLVTALP